MSSHALKDLADRRVPHIAAGYLAGSWGLIEFISFLEGRFMFSPHWTNLTLMALALLLPSVLLFAYNHGRSGKDRWARNEKIGIPVNLVGLVLILFVTFGGTDLGAVTTTVTVEDEEGNAVERVIPKSEFRKRLALFHFTPATGTDPDFWYGLHETLRLDLSQDMFLEMALPIQFREDAREAGFADPTAVPLTLKRQLAGKMHFEYLLDGDVSASGDSVVATVRVHGVETGKVVHEATVRAADVFEAADSLSVAVRRGLGVPPAHLAESQDLAVREMLTASDVAFTHFVDGQRAIEVDDDWAGALTALEQATTKDETFALANFVLYLAALFSQQPQEARAAIDRAMQHAYRLPERYQYDIRYSYYYARQQVDQAFKVLEMKAELFPDDLNTHEQLAMMKQLQGDRQGAIASLERVLELAPAKTEHLKSIASVHRSLGEFEKALEYLKRYAARHPDDASSYTSVGDLYRRMGRHEDARAQYEKAITVDDDPALPAALAVLERSMGEFDAAEARLQERLAAATTPMSRADAHGALGEHYAYRGQTTLTLEHFEAQLAEAAGVAPPLLLLDLQSELIDDYVDAGRADHARALVRGMTAQLQPPLDAFSPFMELELHLALGDAAAAREAADRAEPAFSMFAMESGRPEFLGLEGRIAELAGDCRGAIAKWEEQAALDPTDSEVPARIGRCHRQLGNLTDAERLIRRTLELYPSHPRAHYELALTLEAKGDRAGAIAELESAVETWAPADEGYAHARRAREKLAELRAVAIR